MIQAGRPKGRSSPGSAQAGAQEQTEVTECISKPGIRIAGGKRREDATKQARNLNRRPESSERHTSRFLSRAAGPVDRVFRHVSPQSRQRRIPPRPLRNSRFKFATLKTAFGGAKLRLVRGFSRAYTVRLSSGNTGPNIVMKHVPCSRGCHRRTVGNSFVRFQDIGDSSVSGDG